MYGTFLQGKLERYGGAVVFVRTRQTCPSVSVGDIIQDRKQRRSQPRRKWPVGQLDSWRSSNVLVKFSSLLHHRRRCIPLALCVCMCSSMVSSNEEGDERKRRRIVAVSGCVRCHVEFPRCREDVSIELRLCFWVDRLLHRHFARPPRLSLTPFDFVSGLWPISTIARQNWFPKHFVHCVYYDARGPRGTEVSDFHRPAYATAS